MRVAAEIGLYLLAANGLRVVIGLPPMRDWFRKTKTCAVCKGRGYVYPFCSAPKPERKEADG